MAPRANVIRTATHTQPTPAPLLATRKGQYPNLPYQLAEACTPPSTTALLHIPLPEWHTLNPNTGLTTAALLPSLRALPLGDPTIASFIANPSAITFLALRPPSTTAFVTATPGKSLSIATARHSHTAAATPSDILHLHHALRTDFVAAPADHPPLCPPPSRAHLQRRAARLCKLRDAFLATGATHVIASIGGGDSAALRAASARAAVANGVVGYSIDGLYAGESPATRAECVRAAVRGLPEEGIRILAGGSGAPWEVLPAVRAGVDVVEADYPFEAAAAGYATNLSGGGVVTVRDRRWETCNRVLVEGCGCLVCVQRFSRGYLRHLFDVHEIMAVSLVAAHNLWDYFRWFERLREAVVGGRFDAFVDEFETSQEAVRLANG